MSRSAALLKRTVDVIGATLALVVLGPFGLLVALAIRLDSPGPALFRQTRVGRFEAPFRMFKFRTMVNGAQERQADLLVLNESEGIFKLRHDPRITRVGRLLRRTSLDEFPQFLNVLRGEMSLVGPRPLVPEEDRLILGRHRDRLQMRPGLTGPWQVHGPVRPPLSEMAELDYKYGLSWSLWTDVKIIFWTLVHIARLRGV